MTNNQPERSVEEIVEHVETLLNKEGQLLTEDAEDYLTQTLQAERQRCEERVEAVEAEVTERIHRDLQAEAEREREDFEAIVEELNAITNKE